jgi:hypothetical protein
LAVEVASRPRARWQTLYLAAAVVACGATGLWLWLVEGSAPMSPAGTTPLSLEEIPFDGAQAYEYLKQLCEFGPRPSGSEAMRQQQKYLVEHFRNLGAQVTLQEFSTRHPTQRRRVTLANIVVEWHPQTTERILLCAHYDTRPYPDQDPLRPRGRFVGANDGASGTALLMELGRHMPQLRGTIGVDFVLFDGEEFVYSERDRYFLGSTHFARQYAARRGPPRYRYGVLLDMVADAQLEIYQEQHSVRWPDTRPLVDDLWDTARRLGVREFIARARHLIRDDHLPLHEIARIPTCDVIDFDYPYWHTERDLPEQCSALSLAKVGWVLHEWLKQTVANEGRLAVETAGNRP